MELKPEDIVVSTYSSGSRWIPYDNGVKITHIPSGISASCHTERSQHANKAKAYDQLVNTLKVTVNAIQAVKTPAKPTIELTYKELHERINLAIDAVVNSKDCVLWKNWPGTNMFATAATDALKGVVEFGKGTIVRGSRVRILQGCFSAGSVGTVDFVEPLRAADSKVWVTRDGDSSPKFWFLTELELVTE